MQQVSSQDLTFHLFDQRYGPVPVTCNFVFVSEDLALRVAAVGVNIQTRGSDHQPKLFQRD